MEGLSRKFRGAARNASGGVWAFWDVPTLHDTMWVGHARRIDTLLSDLDPGTCDWRDSWIENPLYDPEGE